MRNCCAKTTLVTATRAFTIPEVMIASSLFVLMVAGLISTNIFALRQDELVNSKLGANDQSRLGFNLMLGELRSCKDVQVGTGSASNFTAISNGALQQGSALQIIPSTNVGTWIRYYFQTNTNTCELRRVASFNTNSIRICFGLTNPMTFQVMDYTGNVISSNPTNYTYNYVVGATLVFAQYQYPITYVGPSQYYNSYQLSFKVARRAP